jgi:hypothetical protein
MTENEDSPLRVPVRPFARITSMKRGTRPAPVVGEPRIAAFIWGRKIRPNPTLPYGRWKGAA